MLTCDKCFYLKLLPLTLTIMVVLAARAPLPTGKVPRVGLSRRVSYELLMESSSVTTTTLEQHQHETNWSKEMLAKREAAPHAAPFIVSIQMMTPEDGLVHYCAGTIINENWILTAAHCLGSSEVVENSVIVAGCHDIHATDQDAECVQLRNIDYYVRHELFLGGVNPYDIALVYTRQPLEFNEYVKPAQLPEQDADADGYGTLYGWGNVSMTIVPNYPHKLQEADMPILDMTLCEQVLALSGYVLHATNLCTGPLSGGVSICTADSGGPLIQQDTEDLYEAIHTVVGIVSWGKLPCGQKNAPSVFVRVSAFTDWINQVITTTTQFI